MPDFSINEIKAVQFSLITTKAVSSPKLLLSVQDKDGKILSQTSKELFISESALKKAKINSMLRSGLIVIIVVIILGLIGFLLLKKFRGKVKQQKKEVKYE